MNPLHTTNPPQTTSPETPSPDSSARETGRFFHRRRMVLLSVGTVLWGAVFFWLFRMWQERTATQPHTAPRTLRTAGIPHEGRFAFQPFALPDFSLVDQQGRPVTKKDLLGRRWVASFLFTRCTGQCPVISRHLRNLQEAVRGTDVMLVSITVDPEHDTPAALRDFARRFEADDSRWLFLTGPKDKVYRLIREGFHLVAAENRGPQRTPGQQFTHSPRVLLVDEKGRVVGSYVGTDILEVEKLRQRLLHAPRPRPSGAGKSAGSEKANRAGQRREHQQKEP